jgi:hypothetical protein
LDLLQPILNKIQIEKESLQNTKNYIADQVKRIDTLEATIFVEKADDQFAEIRNKVALIEKNRAESVADIQASIHNQRKDFEKIQFEFKNMISEFDGIRESASTIREQFKNLQNKFLEELKVLNGEIGKCNKRSNDAFEVLNTRQSYIDEELKKRFQQMDVQNVKINKVSALQAVTVSFYS